MVKQRNKIKLKGTEIYELPDKKIKIIVLKEISNLQENTDN